MEPDGQHIKNVQKNRNFLPKNNIFFQTPVSLKKSALWQFFRNVRTIYFSVLSKVTL